ncbi:MAG: PBP1A family penicillin-binding protein [bacterium]|nr:PBP1A family penicillin-binding protein [bacterium]
MARQKTPRRKNKKDNYPLSQLVLFLVLVPLVIGDTMLLLADWIHTRIKKTYSIIRSAAKSLALVIVSGFEDIRHFSSAVRARINMGAIPKMHPSAPRPTKHSRTYQYRMLHRTRVQYFFFGVIVSLMFILLPYNGYLWLMALPRPQLLSGRELEVTTKIFDRHGTLLYEMYRDENRTPVKLSDIPDYVRQATIAIEDRDFYTHQGFSPTGIARAIRETLVYGRVQGGSTITQQLIKSALLSPEVKLSRKIKEILLAFWAERLYTKDQILEMYLNQVPYGGTAWGIEAASQTYFGKSAKSLSLSEAALLAGLPAAPTEYSPFHSPKKAQGRQQEVFRRMTEDGYITKDQARASSQEPLVFAKQRIAIRAPHFVMYVKSILEEKYGSRLIERGGLRIMTSLDLEIQEKAEEILRTNLSSLARLRVGNGALLVTDPKTGEILAMVGSRDYFDTAAEGNVNVTESLRPPGSSIKVVTYASALEKGFTAATIINDSPVVYWAIGAPPYAPTNYDNTFHGNTPLRLALANSYNIPAVKVLNAIGIKTMIDKGRLMGIESWIDEKRYGLSLTLGGGDVTMLDMARVYGTLANSGEQIDLMPILEINDYTGNMIERNRPKKGINALRPEAAWIISHILSDNDARSRAFGYNSSLTIQGKTVSAKTGTSNEKRDNWTIGYTPTYVVVVWVGNNDNSPMDPYLSSGVTGAAPIWHDTMEMLLKEKADETFPQPKNVIAVPCYFGKVEYFIRGTEPSLGRCVPFPSSTPSLSPSPQRGD